MTSPADSVKKRRDSNMELLRIVAMLLVCVVHANFRALPVPTYEDVFTNVSSSLLRYLTESLSIICVNLFVLLSGWYGLQLELVSGTIFIPIPPLCGLLHHSGFHHCSIA